MWVVCRCFPYEVVCGGRFVVVLVRGGEHGVQVFFAALSRAIGLPWPLADDPIGRGGVAVRGPIYGRRGFLTNDFRGALDCGVIDDFRQGMFCVRGVLGSRFLFEVVHAGVGHSTVVYRLFVSSASYRCGRECCRDHVSFFRSVCVWHRFGVVGGVVVGEGGCRC